MKPDWNTEESRPQRPAQPAGRLPMVLDTDTYNEVDDQFALAYALLSPEALDVQAVYAAPFSNARAATPGEGMEKSYGEILRLLKLMGMPADGFVYRGATQYLGQKPQPTAAAEDLIRRAAGYTPENPLYVVGIGAITNIATAILLEPSIIGSIRVVWLGGNPLSYPTAREFNLRQDIPAVRTVLDCGVPLTVVPCLGVASHMLATVADLKEHLAGKNALCDALVKLFSAYREDHFGWAKEIWDIVPIAYLINPEWVPTVAVHSPLLTDDCHWASDARRHFIRTAYFAYRTPIFADLYRKLAQAK